MVLPILLLVFFLIIFFIYTSLSLIRLCLIYTVYRSYSNSRGTLKKRGDWAIVTGATAGIGRAIANELASDGLNLILISRSSVKLQETSKDIEKDFQVKTACLDVDFTKSEVYPRIKTFLEPYEKIAILVNNVGVSYDHPDTFATSFETDHEKIQSMINCNNLSMVQMSRLVLERCYESKNDPSNPYSNKPVIINMGSYSGFNATPFLTVYAATKAFVHSFTKSLALETAKDGVIVQAFTPYFVVTAMSKIKHPTWMNPSAEDYAKSCINMLGMETISFGYLPHALFDLAMNFFPIGIREGLIAAAMTKLRDRYYIRAKRVQ